MDKNNNLSISFIHNHASGDIMISEILYHYHDVDNYIATINIMIISHITTEFKRATCTILISLL